MTIASEQEIAQAVSAAARHCPATSGDLLTCDEPLGHRTGGWHYDAAYDVTWKPGAHLPGPDEG